MRPLSRMRALAADHGATLVEVGRTPQLRSTAASAVGIAEPANPLRGPRRTMTLEAPDLDTPADPVTALVHPHLRAHEAELEARRAGLDLARRAFLADFEVMASYNTMWDMRERRLMAGVGVNLPIWRQRRRAAVAGAEAQLAEGEAELLDRRRQCTPHTLPDPLMPPRR